MITERKLTNLPTEHELESAAGSYLMSMLAVMAGLPFPIINLIASFIFYFGNRRASQFVRWHCTQALLSQLFLLVINSTGAAWTLTILFSDQTISNAYLGYVLTMAIFNISELLITTLTAIKTRRGIHIEWLFFGTLTNHIRGVLND